MTDIVLLVERRNNTNNNNNLIKNITLKRMINMNKNTVKSRNKSYFYVFYHILF